MKVELAQRDVPVQVINEYYNKDRSFNVCPEFNEDKLPRVLMYSHFKLTHYIIMGIQVMSYKL